MDLRKRIMEFVIILILKIKYQINQQNKIFLTIYSGNK